jgi:hypothetical protein
LPFLIFSGSETSSNKFQIIEPLDHMILQRSTQTGGIFGLGAASLPLVIDLRDSTSLEYRLLDAFDSERILCDWTIAAAALPAGLQTVKLTIPANKAWYLIELRSSDDHNNTVITKNKIGAGEIIAVLGQSLVVDFFAAVNNDGDSVRPSSLGVSPSQFSSVFASWYTDIMHNHQPLWLPPSDRTIYRSAFAAEFLRLMVAASHVNCALIGYGRNGQPISQFMPGAPNNIIFKNIVHLAGGSFSTLIYVQGHGDSVAGLPQHRYLANLNEIIKDLTHAFGAFKTLLCSIPSLAARTEGSPVAVNSIRAAHMQFAAGCSSCEYVAGLDAILDVTGVHPTSRSPNGGNMLTAAPHRRFDESRQGGPAAA